MINFRVILFGYKLTQIDDRHFLFDEKSMLREKVIIFSNETMKTT